MSWLGLPHWRQLVISAARGPTAVNVQDVTSDEPRRILSKEHDCTLKVLWLPQAPHWRAADAVFPRLWRGIEDLIHQLRAIEVRRRNRVYPDVLPRIFDREHARARVHSALRRVVPGSPVFTPHLPEDRTDVDDRAASLLKHLRGREPAAVDRRDKVQLDNRSDALKARKVVPQARTVGVASVVDEDVDAPVFADDALEQPLELFFVGDVASERARTAAVAAHHLGCLID